MHNKNILYAFNTPYSNFIDLYSLSYELLISIDFEVFKGDFTLSFLYIPSTEYTIGAQQMLVQWMDEFSYIISLTRKTHISISKANNLCSTP